MGKIYKAYENDGISTINYVPNILNVNNKSRETANYGKTGRGWKMLNLKKIV